MSTEPRAVLLALESTDAEERRQALQRIGPMSVEDAMPLLVRALGDDVWRVRKEASAIARTFATEPLLIRTLVALLGTSRDVGLRNAAVEVLAASGHAATAEVTRQMGALDADGRKLAVEILGHGGDPAAFPVLEACLADEEANIRQAAAEMLVVLGARVPLGSPLRAALTRALGDPDPLVSMTALDGLTSLGSSLPWERLAPLLEQATLRSAALRAAALSSNPAAIERLVESVASGRSAELAGALAALARIARGPGCKDVGARVQAAGAALLTRIMNVARGDGGEPLEVQGAALLVAAAARIPGAAKIAIGAMSDASRAPHAQRALEVLGCEAAGPIVEAIHEAAADTASTETHAVLVELGASIARGLDAGRSGLRDAIVSALRAGARSFDPALAAAALTALADLGTSADLALAAELLTSPAPHAAEHALLALAARFPVAARELLSAGLPSQGALSAMLLLSALARSAPLTAAELALATQAATTKDGRTRRAALGALATSDSSSADTMLDAALDDDDLTVRLAAARWLGRRTSRAGATRTGPGELVELVQRKGDPALVAALIRSMGESMTTASDPRHETEQLCVLRSLMQAGSSVIVLAAIDAVGRAPSASPERRDALFAGLAHADHAVVLAALLKLGADRDALKTCEAHPSAEVRQLVRELSGGVVRP